MATRSRRIDRADQRAGALLARLGSELRAARRLAGLSQVEVGRGAHLSHAEIGRIERARAPWVSIPNLSRIASVVGLDVSIRTYPGARPLRDARHAALLEVFRRSLGPGLRWRTEVPLPIPGDQRAWDATVSGPIPVIGVEAETELHDVQALERRLALKQRDSRVGLIVLLVADTRANRAALRAAPASMTGLLPLAGGNVMAALRVGRAPERSGLVWVRVNSVARGEATSPRRPG